MSRFQNQLEIFKKKKMHGHRSENEAIFLHSYEGESLEIQEGIYVRIKLLRMNCVQVPCPLA